MDSVSRSLVRTPITQAHHTHGVRQIGVKLPHLELALERATQICFPLGQQSLPRLSEVEKGLGNSS